jgi:hypothetical protein
MAEKDRIVLNGVPQDFTCENSRFRTDVDSGFQHSNGYLRGSALPQPLVTVGDSTLWLEHVVDKRNPRPDRGALYWLMWYRNGIPAIPASGVLTADDLRKASLQLADFFRGGKQ